MTKQWIKSHYDNGEQLHLARRMTTVAPIACLLEWDSAQCQIFHRKRPLFAPNLAYSRTTHGLITPVLPIARITEEGVESSIILLNTPERTSTVTVPSAKTTIASLKQPENLAQENGQATINVGPLTLEQNSAQPCHYRYRNELLNPDINPNCQCHYKNNSDYYNCPEIAAISTFSASLSPGVSQASAAPSFLKRAISKQPNRNYFEDLWSDIVGPPDIIIDSGQKELGNKTTRTTLPTVTKTINNFSTRPLTIITLHATLSTHQSVSLDKEATHRSDKSLSSATTKIASFLLNISTKSSLVIENGKEKKKGIEGPEAKNSGVIQPQHKPQRVLTASTLSSTIKHRIRTTLVSHTIYAVRPTTPMGELITDTVKTPATPTDFPRTALISIASLSVIIIIAIVVFCVFRCRQSGPSTDQYPMVCSGKQSGYAPIPAEVSPPMMRETPRQNVAPFFQNRINQPDGYQPIKGAVIPNGNNLANNIKGDCTSSMNGRKKEFKEWYV